MPINIHGKEYWTVAERLELARKDILSVETELLSENPLVVVKAVITTRVGVFHGISGANPAKAIEKMSPYEVAETSAVGRALGFAGYGAPDGIASADEMVKAGATEKRVMTKTKPAKSSIDETEPPFDDKGNFQI